MKFTTRLKTKKQNNIKYKNDYEKSEEKNETTNKSSFRTIFHVSAVVQHNRTEAEEQTTQHITPYFVENKFFLLQRQSSRS